MAAVAATGRGLAPPLDFGLNETSLSIAVLRDPAELSEIYFSDSGLLGTADTASDQGSDGMPEVLKLERSGAGQETRVEYLTPGRAAMGRRARAVTSQVREGARTVFIQARTIWGTDDSARFADIAVQKRTPDLVKALQVIEPRLTEMQAIPVRGSTRLFGDIGLPKLVALADMGDGMNRLTRLVLAISSAQGGTVLVDEIENGLHYSVHEDVWRVISEALDRFDVQLFATTHSRECIAAAHAVYAERSQCDLGVHRLQRIGEQVADISYDCETLGTALESRVEIL
jgi:hypothetical protein